MSKKALDGAPCVMPRDMPSSAPHASLALKARLFLVFYQSNIAEVSCAHPSLDSATKNADPQGAREALPDPSSAPAFAPSGALLPDISHALRAYADQNEGYARPASAKAKYKELSLSALLPALSSRPENADPLDQNQRK